VIENVKYKQLSDKFQESSFDQIINIEQSHNYHSFEKFIEQSFYVLKPSGVLCIADFINIQSYARIIDLIKTNNFVILQLIILN